MKKSVVVEAGGQAVAVAAPVGGSYKFVAVKFEVWDLDGQIFSSVQEAERAAARLIAGGKTNPAPEPVQIAHIAAYENWQAGQRASG